MSVDADELERIAGKMRLIARPGIEVETTDGAMRWKIVTREDPVQDLIVYDIRLLVDDLAAHEAALVFGFSDFSELAALMMDNLDLDDLVPIVLAQDLYNRGIAMNPHGLYDVLDARVATLANDAEAWRRA